MLFRFLAKGMHVFSLDQSPNFETNLILPINQSLNGRSGQINRRYSYLFVVGFAVNAKSAFIVYLVRIELLYFRLISYIIYFYIWIVKWVYINWNQILFGLTIFHVFFSFKKLKKNKYILNKCFDTKAKTIRLVLI